MDHSFRYYSQVTGMSYRLVLYLEPIPQVQMERHLEQVPAVVGTNAMR